jgi:hypothetical protein
MTVAYRATVSYKASGGLRLIEHLVALSAEVDVGAGDRGGAIVSPKAHRAVTCVFAEAIGPVREPTTSICITTG